jgi:hypothetical protein
LQLIPWGSSSSNNKKKGKKGQNGLNWKERLDQIAKQGQSAYREVYRRAKVLRSSAFEGMLLKATWPGDKEVSQETLNEIIKHSIPAFKYGRSVDTHYSISILIGIIFFIFLFLFIFISIFFQFSSMKFVYFSVSDRMGMTTRTI